MEGQVLVETGRRCGRCGVPEKCGSGSEREKGSRDSGEGDEKVRWVIMAGGPKWWCMHGADQIMLGGR